MNAYLFVLVWARISWIGIQFVDDSELEGSGSLSHSEASNNDSD
jgi:hypothetical protein